MCTCTILLQIECIVKLTVEAREEEVNEWGTHMRSTGERRVKREANELLGETLRVKFSG